MIASLLLVAATLQPECVLQPGSAPLVLLVQGASDQLDLERRLVAELASAGIRAELIAPAPGADPAAEPSLATRAGRHGAFAALRIERPGGRTRVRIVYADSDPASGPEDVLAAGDDDALAFAWRVLDVLNARLLAARLVCRRVEQARAAKPPPASPEPAPRAEAPPRRFAVEAGPALLLPLAPEPTLALGVALALFPMPGLRLELDSNVSLLPAGLERERGTAEIGFCRAQLGVLYEPEWWAWGRPFVGLGSGLVVVWAEGAHDQGYTARSDATAVWHVGLSAGLAVPIADAWDLRLAFSLGLPYHEIGIRMGDRTVARVGRPLLDLGLRLAWRL